MARSAPSCVVRQLCDPVWFKTGLAEGHATAGDELLVVSGQCHAQGHASRRECDQLVSSSFLTCIEHLLPMPPGQPGSTAAGLGGCWFWETYRHALFGENVLVHLGGSGISLSEDTLDSQAELRRSACTQETATESSQHAKKVLLHGSAKLEVVCAIALSVALHVARQPLLEDAEGPQALILCATKDQCDEVTHICNQFCTSLHLVVHNLFDPYPAMPADKRAEVVVATAPLWESLAQFEQRCDGAHAAADGLEDLLLKMSGEGRGQLPPMYDLTRWRPYGLAHVAQLVVFDVELQVNMGFGGLLQRVLEEPRSAHSAARQTRGHSPTVAKLPPSCQLYAVTGGDRFVARTDVAQSILNSVRSRGQLRSNIGTAEVSLTHRHAPFCIDTDVCAAVPHTAVKRPRSDDGASDGNDQRGRGNDAGRATATSPPLGGLAFEGLLIRGALSHARLLADFSAFTDFVDRVVQDAGEFWERFEGGGASSEAAPSRTPSPASSPVAAAGHAKGHVQGGDTFPPQTTSAAVLQHVSVELALVCSSARRNGSVIGGLEMYRAQEVGVWVHPAPSSPPSFSSRLALLFQHLSERLSGELFDGSVVQCVLAHNAERLPFTLHPLSTAARGGNGSAWVQHQELFRYGPDLQPPTALVITRKEARALEEVMEALHAARHQTVAAVDRQNFSAEGPPRWPHCIPASCFLPSPGPSQEPKDRFTVSCTAPPEWSTVLVVRNLASSRAALCSSGYHHEAAKPLAHLLLEECCQYGRVLSYFTHEVSSPPPPTRAPARTDHLERLPPRDGAGQALTTDTDKTASAEGADASTSASLFVEFSTADAAAEAVRLLSRRFVLATLPPQVTGAATPRARLFANAVYYDGVRQELSLPTTTAGDSDDEDGADDDSFFGDLLPVSLLAE